MGTGSTIGIENSDKTVLAVECNHDGYPSWVGKKLFENYNTEEKIRELMSYGDLDGLDILIGYPHDIDERTKDICTFYIRDAKLDGHEARLYHDVEAFLRNETGSYTYLFRDGKWHFHGWKESFRLLTKKDIS